MEQKDKNFDLEEIKEIIKEIGSLMKEFGLAEVEIKDGSKRVVLRCAMPILGSVISPVAQPQTEIKDSGKGLGIISSPTPGIFHASADPDSEPYVKVGSEVEPQTRVCIIEAMKVMNEINAEVSGTIVEILAKNGQAVEYGTPLFKVRPK